jgi:hypothetical protein
VLVSWRVLLVAALVCVALGAVGGNVGTAYASGPPTVTSVKPSSGPATGGTLVHIKGTNFTEVTAVSFGSNSATSFTVESGVITAQAPAGAGTVDVTVTTPEGTSATSSADRFSYLPAVTSLSPGSGPVDGGTAVTITGGDFTGATAVKFGSSDAVGFTVNSDESITAVSPAELEGTVDVRVTTPEGTSPKSPNDRFKFTPTVTGVSPGTGPPAGGTHVTVTGTGFAVGETATVIKLGGVPAVSVNCATTTECTAITPELLKGQRFSGTVDVRATVNKIISPTSPADHFDYHGLYLRGETRLPVGTFFSLRFVTAGHETNLCEGFLGARVNANGEATDEIGVGVTSYTDCFPEEWSGVLPGFFTLRLNSDGSAAIEGKMGVHEGTGCVYAGSSMSGGFEIGVLLVRLSGTFALVAEEEPGAECSPTETVEVLVGDPRSPVVTTELVT